jgi:hypothetical protein
MKENKRIEDEVQELQRSYWSIYRLEQLELQVSLTEVKSFNLS